jgi:hypothetical protein
LSPFFSSDSHPGIADLSTSGSFNSVQTFGLSAGKVTSPVIVMAIKRFLPTVIERSRNRSGSASYVKPAFRNAREISRRRGVIRSNTPALQLLNGPFS